MGTNKTLLDKSKKSHRCIEYQYKLAVITKNDSRDTYGIAVQDVCNAETLCVKELGTDKEQILSIIEVLNDYRVPFVHFLDVVSDILNE